MAVAMSLIRWIERLSLDAVLVAVAWGWGLMHVSGIPADPLSILILGLATWLTYVADRLRDCRPGEPAPRSDRHRYYKNHYKSFAVTWALVFAPTVFLALSHLPFWKWAGGWAIVTAISLYLWLLGIAIGPVGRMVLKRTAVPIIFTAGVAWMSESWRYPEGRYATLALLAGALLNLLLISSHENRNHPQLYWLPKAFLAVVLVVALFEPAGITFHPAAGLSALCFTIPYLLALPLIRRRPAFPVRFFADFILLVAAIPLVLVR